MRDQEEGKVKVGSPFFPVPPASEDRSYAIQHETPNSDLDDDSFLHYGDSKPSTLPIHRIGLKSPVSK